MIVRLLSSSAGFNGVQYNFRKIDRNQGELMLVRNFSALQSLERLRPADYRNYLKLWSAQNSRIRNPQFHAVISAKGRTCTKETLTDIAVQWMSAMGYGQQPYLVVFHQDTGNNHVHIISTRVDCNGRKINSAYERVRAVQQLNHILQTDEGQQVLADVDRAFSYAFATPAQWMMLLENQGYALKTSGENFDVCKFGQRLLQIPVNQVEKQAAGFVRNQQRQQQLKAIFGKYSQRYQTTLTRRQQPLAGGRTQVLPGFTSEFARFLETDFGIILIFHAKNEQLPYGYTIIDHAGQAVWKGSEVMRLQDLLQSKGQERFDQHQEPPLVPEDLRSQQRSGSADQAYYGALLKAASRNYPDVSQGLQQLGLTLTSREGQIQLVDPVAQVSLPLAELIDPAATAWPDIQEYVRLSSGHTVPGIMIAEDIDDEQINGRNRRRKKKARTSTR